MLSPSESVGVHTHLFEPISRRWKLYRAQAQAQAQALLDRDRDLGFARQSMSAMLEEQQLFNQERESTNEALQSTNEALQSTNEKLVTINAELQIKMAQMAIMHGDLKNLLDNIRVGAVVLDRQLKIRRFTRDATRLFRLEATDAGRPLCDISSDLSGDGVVITFVDVTRPAHAAVMVRRIVDASGASPRVLPRPEPEPPAGGPPGMRRHARPVNPAVACAGAGP